MRMSTAANPSSWARCFRMVRFIGRQVRSRYRSAARRELAPWIRPSRSDSSAGTRVTNQDRARELLGVSQPEGTVYPLVMAYFVRSAVFFALSFFMMLAR